MKIRVLYDGWALSRDPVGPAALHLLEIIAQLPDEVDPTILFPESPPDWIPPGINPHVEITPNSSKGLLKWEQRTLPKLKETLEMQLLHLTSTTPALIGGKGLVISPTGYGARSGLKMGFADRVRSAFAAGGMVRVGGLLWPIDLPNPEDNIPTFQMSPMVHPDFWEEDKNWALSIPGVNVPESYVLYHGPRDPRTLERALQAWTWSAGPIGYQYPLVLIGLDNVAADFVRSLIERFDLEETVFILPAITPNWIPPIYHTASALFHPAPVSPWGGAVRRALACGKPVVALDTTLNSALVGPAAYLIDLGEPHKLGSGVIAVIVKDELVSQLKKAARERVASWVEKDWGKDLLRVYEKVARSH